MGGAVRRPQNGWSKIGKSNLGAYLRFRSNLLYQKLLKKSTRSAPPPAAESGGLPRRKIFSAFLFCACPLFSSKRKRKFFCFGFRAQSAGRWGFASARGQKFLLPN